MARQILIPLRGTDRIEKVLPYVERSAHAGVKVVFVVHYGLTGFRDLIDQLLAHQQEDGGDLLSRAGNRQISHDENRPADQKILIACRRLANRGAEIDVIVYGCILSAVLEKYLDKEGVELIPDTIGDDCKSIALGKSEPTCGRAHLQKLLPSASRPEKFTDTRRSN